ncbi:DUF177 domain-containing protein [bacterium]|nr:DUF177 domain-containing protein [bacterium]MBU1637195.1 DUF177 domain-containing protein [bacterium]MBU1921397.1 DUF177 domain-containing protein [bacterium]
MKIHLPAYSQSLHTIEESLKPEELGLPDALRISDIHLKLQLDRHDPYLDFKIAIEARINLECDRCLEPYETVFKAEGPMLFILGSPPADDEVDDTDVEYIPLGTRDLDLADILHDFVILAIPSRNLCSEDCKGLCMNCGANLNTESCTCENKN